MEHRFTCSVCNSHKGFRLVADYGSSGLWCITCGVCFGDPKMEFPRLPPGLVDLLDVWNGYWETFADEKSKYNYEVLHDIYYRRRISCPLGE